MVTAWATGGLLWLALQGNSTTSRARGFVLFCFVFLATLSVPVVA